MALHVYACYYQDPYITLNIREKNARFEKITGILNSMTTQILAKMS